MKNKILLIETSDVGAEPTAQAVIALGFEPVFLVNLGNYQGDTLAQIQRYEHYQLDTTSVSEILKFVRSQTWAIEAVTTFLDSRLAIAIEIAQKLGVRGLEPALLAFKDKGEVERLSANICPPSVSFCRADIPLEELEILRRRFSAVILKPRCTAGGLGARVFTADEPITNLIQHIEAAELPSHLQPEEWMAQAFVEGELISAEGFIENGVLNLLGLTGRRKIGNTECWSGFPYEQQITPVANAIAQSKLHQLIALTDLQNSFFHIEFIVNATDAYVIDANLGRMGGGGIGEILATSYGVTPTQIFSEVLRISLKLKSAACEFWNDEPKPAISIAYGFSSPCQLLAVEIPEGRQVMHTLILEKGDVSAMGANNWAWVGIASGQRSAVLNFLEGLSFETSNGVMPAMFIEAGV